MSSTTSGVRRSLYSRHGQDKTGPWDLGWTRDYAATVEELWHVITNLDTVQRWLAPLVDHEGDVYRFELVPTHVVTITIEQCRPPHLLELHWKFNEDDGRYIVNLRTVDDQTSLRLRRAGLTKRDHVIGYGGAWEKCLVAIGTELGEDHLSMEELYAIDIFGEKAWKNLLST